MNTCSNCHVELKIEHAFCPHCGFDLRNSKSAHGQNERRLRLSKKTIFAIIFYGAVAALTAMAYVLLEINFLVFGGRSVENAEQIDKQKLLQIEGILTVSISSTLCILCTYLFYLFFSNWIRRFKKDMTVQSTNNDSQVNIESNRRYSINTESPKSIRTKGYFLSLFAGILFSGFSIFIWSYVYTNFKFNLNIFFGRLVNHMFWIFLVPYTISILFNREKRLRIFSIAVACSIALGAIFLFFGYQEFSSNTDPLIIRLRLLQPCTRDVIKQLEKEKITNETRQLRASNYCECLTRKINEPDLIKIGSGQSSFWDIVNQNYKIESLECINESIQNPNKENELPPPPKKKPIGTIGFTGAKR